jgi:hypothetical protein
LDYRTEGWVTLRDGRFADSITLSPASWILLLSDNGLGDISFDIIPDTVYLASLVWGIVGTFLGDENMDSPGFLMRILRAIGGGINSIDYFFLNELGIEDYCTHWESYYDDCWD